LSHTLLYGLGNRKSGFFQQPSILQQPIVPEQLCAIRKCEFLKQEFMLSEMFHSEPETQPRKRNEDKERKAIQVGSQSSGGLGLCSLQAPQLEGQR
jgi:hypothetical protein